jgi:hypothetical protein
VEAVWDEERTMRDLVALIGGNGIWIMIIAVVGIASWFKFREKELRSHEAMRTKEMEHLQKMKELEIELEKTKGRSSTGQAS